MDQTPVYGKPVPSYPQSRAGLRQFADFQAKDAAEVASAISTISQNIRIDSLTRFRTIWLRAAALAWIDPAFFEALVNSPTNALKDKFSYIWPWEDSLTLTVRQQEEFIWVGDDWVWPSDPAKQEGLVLRVPLRGPDDARERASALAAYYEQRPSLLSDDNVDLPSSIINPMAFNFSDSLSTFMASRSRAPMPVEFSSQLSRGGRLIPEPTSFLDFQVVLIALMAKAWENKNFRDIIQQEVNVPKALNTLRGYTHPWRLNLKIANDQTATWDKIGWRNLSAHDLLLYLPVAPTKAEEQSIALATYNSTGAEFCFSCCA